MEPIIHSQIIQRMDQIRRRINESNQVENADRVLCWLAQITEVHGYDYTIPQVITGREWCALGIKSANVPLDDLKDLCWQVIEEAKNGRITQNAQTHLPFGLEWGGIADC